MRSNEKCTIKFEDAETMYQATRTLLPNEDGSMDHGLIIGAYLGWALDEIERLQKVISEPLEAFGTPELIAWSQELTRLLDVPESERGGWPFVLSVGCHLEKFAKSWNSQTMAEKDAEIERLRADVDGLVEALAGDDGDVAVNVCINSREQAKRIQTLEAALIEKEAKYIAYQARNPGPSEKTNERIIAIAREKLHEEGLL